MKIAFDIQPLLNNNKSGVGFHEHGLVTEVICAHPNDRFLLECFTWKNRKSKLKIADTYLKQNVTLNECSRFPGTLYRMLFPFLPIPYRLFFRKKAEITHFFNFCIPPGVSGKTVVTVHDMAFRVYPETIRKRTMILLQLNLKRSLKRADKIIAVSEFTKKEIEKYYQIEEEKITVVPNGVDDKVFHPYYPETEISDVKRKYHINQNYLLYLGNLEPRKNIVRLVEAYALFINDKTVTQISETLPILVIAGGKGWIYDAIFEKVEKLGLQDKILFTGYVEEREVPLLMSGAFAFVFPSLYEGFGMPPLEAMACGTPVITSDLSALKEVAGDACILVNPKDTEALKDGMKRLYLDKKLYKTCIEKGLDRAKLFSWKTAADKLYFVYKELTGEKE